MRKLLLLAVFVGAAVAVSPAFAARGTVVANQHGTVLVAGARGTVTAAHGRFAVGTRVATRAGKLVAVGKAHRAVIRGVVVRSRGAVTFVSAGRHLIAIHSGRRLASASDTSPTQPTPGTVVTTTVGISGQGSLDEENEQEDGNTQQVQIQAPVTAVGPGSVTVTVNGQSLTLSLPSGLTLPSSLVGQQVTLTLTFSNGDVTASDDDSQGDEDNGGGSGGSGGGSGSGSGGGSGGGSHD
jgi:uncharacterized membrane protein YgcG